MTDFSPHNSLPHEQTQNQDADQDQVQHQVLGFLTVLQGRTWMLRRRLQQPGVVAEGEQFRVMADLASIDDAVQQLISLQRRVLGEPTA